MNADRLITSRTLLERVRDPADREAWERFHELYAPLILGFACARGLSVDDAEDVRDECLALVADKLQAFRYDRDRGGFKSWLRRIVQGRVIDHLRRSRERHAETAELGGLAAREPSPDEEWERAWRQEHLRFALRQTAQRVSERMFQAFELLLLEGASVPEVCERLGMNANQVYKAKARVLESVREVLRKAGADEEIAGAD